MPLRRRAAGSSTPTARPSRSGSRPATTASRAVVRELDSEGIELADLQLHAPTLDDVFLDKTGRKLEGAGEGAEVATGEHEAVPA